MFDEDHIKCVQLKNTFYKIDDFLAETTTKKEQSKGKTLTTKEQQKEQDERSDNILRCSALKKQIIDILIKPLWQTTGLPWLSDEEGSNRAYSNNQTLYYDGKENYI